MKDIFNVIRLFFIGICFTIGMCLALCVIIGIPVGYVWIWVCLYDITPFGFYIWTGINASLFFIWAGYEFTNTY